MPRATKPVRDAAKARARATKRGSSRGPLERLRKICLALPEAVEKISHGEPTWTAGRGKVFATLDDHHHGAEHLSVWLPAPVGAQEALIESDPHRYFRPPYVGHRGWVAVVLDDDPDWSVVADLVLEAYRLVATRKLLAALDAAQETHSAAKATKPTSAGTKRRR